MDTITAITTRRSVRAWTEQNIPEDLLQTILEAGRFSPSPLNSQGWKFTVIRDKESLKKLMPTAKHASFVTMANVLIVITVDKAAKVDEWLSEHKQHIYSGVCALQNMWLAAWDKGIGGCWVTVDEKTSRELLHIPNDHELIGSLALGYAKTSPSPHAEDHRKPLSDMVYYETFGVTEK